MEAKGSSDLFFQVCKWIMRSRSLRSFLKPSASNWSSAK